MLLFVHRLCEEVLLVQSYMHCLYIIRPREQHRILGDLSRRGRLWVFWKLLCRLFFQLRRELTLPRQKRYRGVELQLQIRTGRAWGLPLRVRHSRPASFRRRITSPFSCWELRSLSRADKSTALAASPFSVLLYSREASSAVSDGCGLLFGCLGDVSFRRTRVVENSRVELRLNVVNVLGALWVKRIGQGTYCDVTRT